MFNIFKKKIGLKSNNDLINSVDYKHGIKLGSEICVPNNFQCFIFSKGRLYATLGEGKHTIDKDLLPKLISTQQKKLKKIKKIKLIAHFISSSNHQLQIKAKKQKYDVNFCIKDTLKFLDLILTFCYKANNISTLNYLGEIFVELLAYNKFDYTTIQSSALDKYGIHINSFKPIGTKNSIFAPKEVDTKSQTTAQEADTSNQSTDYIAHEANSTMSATKLETNAITNKTLPKQYMCHNCGHLTKFKATYCIRCGSTLEN